MKRAKLSTKNAWEGAFLTLPLLAGCLVFYAASFCLVIRSSLYQGIGNSGQFAGLSGHISLIENRAFRLAFGNTIKFLFLSIPLILVIAFGIALLLKSHARRNGALKAVLLLPYIMPVVGSVLLVELLFSEMGLINEGLYTLGLPIADWLHSEKAFGVMVILYLWKNTGYAAILLLSGLVTIPDDQYAAADLDGATFWQKLRYITVPQMWYSVFFAAVFSLINAFKCFREIFLIGGTHPHPSIYMLQHFINNAFDKLNYSKLAAASVLLLAALTVLFVVSYRWVIRKEAYKE